MDNLKEFLDEKADLYNRPSYIESDPIQIPHDFTNIEDIEIAAFLSATIAWGKRSIIIRNARDLIRRMDNAPYNFVMNATQSDLEYLKGFKHRTFNDIDCLFFIKSLQNIYRNHEGLKTVFLKGYQQNNTIESALVYFRKIFFEIPFPERTQKHIANVEKKSSAKRLNMFLRWLVRKDNRGVDFGLWTEIPMPKLYIPLDVHSGNVSRKLGLLHRKQNDWKAVTELTYNARKFAPHDPALYDYALFGLGVFENF